jgi:hypothetical protein
MLVIDVSACVLLFNERIGQILGKELSEDMLENKRIFVEKNGDKSKFKVTSDDSNWYDEIKSIEYDCEDQTYFITVPTTNAYISEVIEHNSTTCGAGIAIYYATQFDYKPYLGTSPYATIPIISPTKTQAGEVYAAIKNMFLRSTYLFDTFLDGKIDNFRDEYTEDKIGKDDALVGGMIRLNNKVVIKVMAADVSKMRGFAVPFAILDEVCFFGMEGSDSKNTDVGIYEALAPALSQFQSVEGMAMVLKISSPNGESGLMYTDYERRNEEDVLHLQVPTWYANPTISVKYLEKQKKKE